jgi:ketol-acid reductoisomerase
MVMILAPDEFQKGIYENQIKPNLKSNAIMGFAHGFNIHFEKIIPEKSNSVIMIAPKGPGTHCKKHFRKWGWCSLIDSNL